jgi:glyoxylase-like metal-dependent hydrolase (beta-lactamase superfamily II)
VVQDDHTTYFLAGDASYNEALMLAGRVDGVSANERIARATLDAIRLFAKDRPMVYLPTHDPGSAVRLASRSTVAEPLLQSSPKRSPAYS